LTTSTPVQPAQPIPSNSALLQTPRLRLRRIDSADVEALLAV